MPPWPVSYTHLDVYKRQGKKTATKAPATSAGSGGDTAGKLDGTKSTPNTADGTESGGVSVAAAIGVNVGVATTTATIGKGRKIASSNGALKVASSNETDTAAKADGSQVDGGKTDVGVGAAVALNVGVDVYKRQVLPQPKPEPVAHCDSSSARQYRHQLDTG